MSFFGRLTNLFRNRALDDALDQELRSHIEMRTDLNVREGMSADDARADAIRRFGNRTRTKEDVRSEDVLVWLENAVQDGQFALRMLRKNPAFTIVAVLTLALGIGANTAIFSVVHAVLIKPLPYYEPDRIMVLEGTHPGRSFDLFRVSAADYRDWEREAKSFSEMALCTYWSNNITAIETPERVVGMAVTGEFFPLLGVGAMRGRTLTANDDRPGAAPVAVLSYSLWKRMFNGREDIVGRTVVLNAIPHVIVGVMPPTFAFPVEDAYLWTSLSDNMNGVPRNARFLLAVGRLKPGVSLEQARTEMNVISRRLEAKYPDTNKDWGIRIVRAQEAIVGNVRSTLVLLLAAIGAVLLMACANVANLLLSRMVNRQKELSVRTALGASRGRLIRQTVTENLILSLLGSSLAIALAFPVIEQLKRLYPADMPRLQQASLNLPVLLFAFFLATAVGVFLGLVAAIRASKADANQALKQGGTTTSQATTHAKFRRVLVVCEIGISVVVLVAGSLLVRSLIRVLAVDPGFRTEHVLTFSFWLTGGKFRESGAQSDFVKQAIQKVGTVPGVTSVAAITQVPMSQGGRTTLRFSTTENPLPLSDAPRADYRAISPGYFQTMGVSLIGGRDFADTDTKDSPRVIIVNRRLAELFWPGRSPIGKQLKWVDKQYDVGAMTIVGVAGDVRSMDLEQPDEPSVYVPYPQRNLPYLRWFGLAVRTGPEPMSLWPTIRTQVLSLDADRAIYDVATTKALVEKSVAERRFNALLLTGFSCMALLLAAIGIYGVISYTVSQRKKEFGIRIALGAQTNHVTRLVLREGLFLALAGIVAGTLVASATSRLLERFLFGLQSHDVITFTAVPALLAGVALAASYLPARRASKADPVAAIRGE